MSHGPPTLIAIDHDDAHAEYVGRTADGRQFFLTTPFEPAIGSNAGRDFLALYTFDARGTLLDAKVEDLGPRATMDHHKRESLRDAWLQLLGDVTLERIEIAPFAIQRFGTTFGLIPREPEDDSDAWAVELHPGNTMAFFPPWDSGEYDT